MTATILRLPGRPPVLVDAAESPHWLIFNSARQVTGCACGFAADVDSDCGFGDSVVDHLLAAGGSDAS